MGVGKKHLLKILMWEAEKGIQGSSHPHFDTSSYPLPFAADLQKRMWHCEFRRQRHFASRLTSGADSHIPMLLPSSKGQHTQTTKTFNHPTKVFRLLVLKRRGRYPQISCHKGICFLQSLNKVLTSLLYTAQKSWLLSLNLACQIFAKRGFIQVRSWMQLEGDWSRKGRSTVQLRSYTG